MRTGLKVTYLWHDNDVIEVRVTVENARFRGTADTYVGTDGLFEAAATLAGFPPMETTNERLSSAQRGKGLPEGQSAFSSTAQTSLAMRSFEQRSKATTGTKK
jgi:hypothetical protein